MTTIPKVLVNQDQEGIFEETWEGIVRLNNPPNDPQLYLQGYEIVRLEPDSDGHFAVRIVNEARLDFYLLRNINFVSEGQDGELRPTSPPKNLARDILARPDKTALPYLRRISKIPLYRADGTLVTTPGYDPISCIYFAPHYLDLNGLSLSPSEIEVDAALDLLRTELLGDFPFVSESDFSHALAIVFQIFVRLIINGPTPLLLIEKPAAGTATSPLDTSPPP